MDKGLLKRALEDTEDPTPGYMFRDIAQWTFIDHSTQTKLIAFLMDKLRPSTSVHVLTKTLRVLKVLCETGHTDFQKEMQRRSDDLKQYASYRGKPDAKFGDKLNEKVRATAREAIDAAFSHRKETKVQVMSGHGSDSTYEEAKNTFTTGSKVTSEPTGWFGGSSGTNSTTGGNANMAPMPTTNKWAEHMASVASGKGGAAGAPPGVVTSFVDAAKTGFGLWQENVKTTEQLVMESMNNGTEFRPVELGFGNQGFGGAGGQSAGAGSSAGGWKFTDEASSVAGVKQEALKILTPFQAEVERICGFKSTPQRVELTQFLTAIEEIADRRNSSDLEELGEVLDEHLQQKYNWQHRLNAMSAIEALLRHQTLDGRESFEQYFKENPEDVQRNIHVVQGSLKEKAQKVLKLLGVPERTKGQNETSAMHQPAQQISVATNAGGFSWASPVAEPEREPSAEASVDISLGGMTVKSRAAKPQEDKTKLRKRAAIKVDDDEDEAPPPAQPAKQAQPTKSAPATGSGWGDNTGNNTASSWGNWGGDQNSSATSQGGWGFDAPATAQQVQPQPQQQQQQAPVQQKPKDALDDFFSGPSSSWGANITPSQPPQQQVAQQAPVQVQQPLAPAPAAPAPASNGINMQMVMQMQQQLQMMLTQINMSDPNAVAQMQALMAQQQQLMTMVTASQQSAPTAASAAPPPPQEEAVVVPHSHFAVQKPQPAVAAPQNDSFAAVQMEMMSRMRPSS